MNTVYPMGYSTDGADLAIDRLIASGTVMLVDTRYSPKSRMPQWREEALRAKYGARYRRAGACLGNKNYQGGPIEIAQPERGIMGLCQYLDEGFDLILLCQCPDYDSCHRKVIVELLVAQKPEVVVAQSVVTALSAEMIAIRGVVPFQPGVDGKIYFTATELKAVLSARGMTMQDFMQEIQHLPFRFQMRYINEENYVIEKIEGKER